LRLKVVGWRHDVQPYTANGLRLIVVGLVLLVVFDCWAIIVVGISLNPIKLRSRASNKLPV
jgi:hypothetical protein